MQAMNKETIRREQLDRRIIRPYIKNVPELIVTLVQPEGITVAHGPVNYFMKNGPVCNKLKNKRWRRPK